MKRFNLFFAVFLSVALLTGCIDSDTILTANGDLFEMGLDRYELIQEGKIPKNVIDTLDFMLDNYTGGVSVPDPNDLKGPDLTSDQLQSIIDNTSDVADTMDEVDAIILKAMSATEPDVSFIIDKSMTATGTRVEDIIFESIYERVGGRYIVESLGGVNYYYYSISDAPQKNGYAVHVTFSYFKDAEYDYGFTLDEVKQMKIELRQKAEQIVRDLNLNSISEYERVAAVNKYLVDTITYTPGKTKMMHHTPYGALMNGDCVCEGYAKSAQLLFSLCGIDSYYITGDTPSGGHGWNLVKVDGNWYQLDVTWNDVDSAPNQYFLVTDDYMKLSRTWKYEKYPQSATTPYQP